jgi:Na+/citrate or Na+/malate symporter
MYIMTTYMADALISYAIVIGVFIGLVAILFASRAKRVGKKKEPVVGTSEEIKHSPA